MNEIDQLKQAIAMLEGQRDNMGDAVVEALLTSAREKLSALTANAHHQLSEGQAKLATVLFADISGFTAISETMDAEDVRDTMNALWQHLDRVIIAHGGRIDKHIGDAVMALWGADEAFEDDPERAIRAALAMQEAIARFQVGEVVTASPSVSPTTELRMRIGINTGLVLLGLVGTTGEFTAMGDAVNVASRLEQAAPVGSILISHDTYRHVRGIFDVRPLTPLTVKGKAEPLQVYIVVQAKPRAFRLLTRGVEGIETRMIGRDSELKHLQEALLTTLESRELQAITIVGEAGLGKSRLMYEFHNWFELQPEDLWLFKGRASKELHQSPYALLRNILAFRFEVADSDSLAVAREKLIRGVLGFMGGDPEAEMKAHFIGHLLGLDFAASPYLRGILDDPKQISLRAFHYLAQLFAAVPRESRQGGIILLLEDVHWADDASLDAIVYLMQTCRAVPLLIVAAARPTLYDRRPKWGEGLETHVRLDIRPLSKRHSRELVDEILKRITEVPQALRELVVSNAEGNPFYAEELVKMLIEERVIIPSEAHWVVEPSRLVEIDVPPTLIGILQARLDGLPHPERTALQKASVIGKVFWDEAVNALSAGTQELSAEALNHPTPALDDCLNALRRKEFIFGREASGFAGANEYIFKHAILHSVTYKTVLKKQRRTYHAQAAAWLVKKSGERANEYAAWIAEHYEQAGELAQAMTWYGQAGKQANDAYAPEAAIDYYKKALEFNRQLPNASRGPTLDLSFSWQEGLGTALRSRARYADAIEAYQALCLAAERAGDGVTQAKAWNELAWTQDNQGNNLAALTSAEHAETLARDVIQHASETMSRTAAQVELADAIYRKGWASYRLGEAAKALAEGEQALTLLIELGAALTPIAQRVQARCLNLLGVVHGRSGRFELSNQFMERALDVYQKLGDRRGIGMMSNNLGTTAYHHGQYTLATTRFQTALTIAREIGDRSAEMVYLNNLSGARIEQEDYTTAENELRQVIKMASTTGYIGLSETHCSLAEACLGQGKSAEALGSAQRALALGQETGNREDIGKAWRVLGKIASQYGAMINDEALDAMACFSESLQVLTEMGAEVERARTIRAWAQHERKHGRLAEGERLWNEAREIFEKLELRTEVEKMRHE